MKTFEIQYISRYYEEKIYSSEVVQAKSEKFALIKFAKKFGIKSYEELIKPNFTWEDGQWTSEFKCINEIIEHECLHCSGSGKLIIYNFHGTN